MMRYLLLVALLFIRFTGMAQTTPGPVEKEMTEKICNSLGKLDFSKITTKEEANAAFMDCVMQHADLFPALADERHVDMTDQEAMKAVGIDLGKNLFRQKCEAFTKLSVLLAKRETMEETTKALNSITGTFKRIDNKGFNYIVITDNTGSEKSFLWLKQFAGSENFMATPVKAAGKKIKISWQDLEVYLPQAKGYYNVKEITGIEIL